MKKSNKEYMEFAKLLTVVPRNVNSLPEDFEHMFICQKKEDFALVVCLMLGENDAGFKVAAVRQDACDEFGKSKAKIFADALANTAKRFSCTVDEEFYEKNGEFFMFSVLTCTEDAFGAVSIFLPGLLEMISERFGDAYLMMPDIRKVLLVPAECVGNVDNLYDEVVNRFTHAKSDKLSRHLYKLTAGKSSLEVVR